MKKILINKCVLKGRLKKTQHHDKHTLDGHEKASKICGRTSGGINLKWISKPFKTENSQ